jgi:hypothetical protein
MFFYLPNLAYQPIFLYVYLPIEPKLPTYPTSTTYFLISYNFFN